MAFEKKGFREELALILEFSGNAHLLTQKDAAIYLGKSVDYCRDHLRIGSEGISAAALASWLCERRAAGC